MATEFHMRPCGRLRLCLPLMVAGTLLAVAGCQAPAGGAQAADLELDTFVQLLMPAKIEIQHYLTKPFDFDGGGDANGLEVILTTLDAFDDSIKCTGTFHFDLHTMRMASGDKLGTQLAQWPVRIDSAKTLMQYWDRYARCYCFPLKLRSGKLPPGHYILSARLITPTSEKLYDTYEFTHGEP